MDLFASGNSVICYDSIKSQTNAWEGKRARKQASSQYTEQGQADESRPVIDTASSWRAVANITSFVQGNGAMALPYAVYKGGIAAVIAFFLIPPIHWYTGKIMIDCIYEDDAEVIAETRMLRSDGEEGRSESNKVRVRSVYTDLGKVLSPRYGEGLLLALQSLDLLILAVSYLISCGTLLAHAIPKAGLSEAIWASIIAAIVLPSTFLKDLACVAWQSLLSITSLVTMTSVLIWYTASHSLEVDVKDLFFWDTEGVLVAIGLVIYSYCVYPILIPVEGIMADCSKFGSALGVSMFITAIFRVIFSITGFLAFTKDTDEVIANNFPLGAPRTIVSVVYVTSAVFSYILIIYPVFQSIDDSKLTSVVTSYIPSFLWISITRILVVFVTLLVAVLIPHFALLISFIGSLVLPFLEYMVPCIVHLRFKWSTLTPLQIAADGTIVVVGAFVTVFGAYFSGKALIDELMSE